ncbi:MAG: hypothetical protein V4717_20420 [Bacteroidota bacterium]
MNEEQPPKDADKLNERSELEAFLSEARRKMRGGMKTENEEQLQQNNQDKDIVAVPTITPSKK